MRSVPLLAAIALTTLLAACDPAPPAAAVNDAPAELKALGEQNKPRLSVPTESVGKDYKPRDFGNIVTPDKNGKPQRQANEAAGEDKPQN